MLGLPCSSRYDRVPGGEYETGTLTLQLLEVEKIGRTFAPTTGVIALHVDDVCHMAIFADPDGNPLLLHHRYAPR